MSRKMFTLAVFVLAFSSAFQYSKCENTQYQNGNQYPQNMVRQVDPATGQQVDANGNPIMQGGGMQGQPMSGQQQPIGGQQPVMGGQQPAMGGQQPVMGGQQPVMGGQQPSMGGQQQPMMPTTEGNQMMPQNGMPNQPFPQQNPAMPGINQQFPTNQQFPHPQNQHFPGFNQQVPHNQGFPGMNQQHYPFQQQGGHGFHYPEPPHDLHLHPEGVHAYGYIMHTIESMLNNPTARNNLYHFFNNLQMVLSNPRSTPIIEEFFHRWSNAIQTPLGQMPNNIVVQNTPSSGSFLDTLKRKGNVLVNLAKDVTMAKTKALNSLFDDSIFSPAVQVGTNWANAGMQAVQGAVTPFIGTSPGMTGQTTTMGRR